MARWFVSNDDNGLPVWRGQDAIFNALNVDQAQSFANVKGCLVVPAVLVGIVVCGTSSIPLGLLIMLGAPALMAMGNKPKISFLGQKWELRAGSDFIEYETAPPPNGVRFSGPNFKVAVSEIARVEIDNTVKYTPARDYGGAGREQDFKTVPEHEWQVFLFMADGTRRVIHHANADRDDCAALAASIRSWLESTRHAPASAASSRPQADGFDL
jgi:hypothetical protein